MKKQKVVWLGKDVEKGEQLENEEFRKQYFIGCGQKVVKLENQECREKKGVNVGGEKGEQLQIEAR